MQIDDSLLFSNELSARAFKTLLYIMRVKELGNSEMFSQKLMRMNFREGRDSIRMAIKELEEKGFIKKEQTRTDFGGRGEIFGFNDFKIIQEKLL